jgi:PilZ domain
MGERRNSRRTKSFLRAFVYVSRKRSAPSCLIRDMSEKGARIIFPDTVTLPDVFDLYIPQRDHNIRARVQWRRNDEIGVAFVASEKRDPAEQPSANEVVQRVALLEAEIASLRMLLKGLKNEKTESRDEQAA